mmetsp:Transcript_12325/g.37995  ORF Transcript_12325/g.37995 Transcript_12325/m.37995 type:complete len:681 (+) Transcript_12325:2239-4281(+)
MDDDVDRPTFDEDGLERPVFVRPIIADDGPQDDEPQPKKQRKRRESQKWIEECKWIRRDNAHDDADNDDDDDNDVPEFSAASLAKEKKRLSKDQFRWTNHGGYPHQRDPGSRTSLLYCSGRKYGCTCALRLQETGSGIITLERKNGHNHKVDWTGSKLGWDIKLLLEYFVHTEGDLDKRHIWKYLEQKGVDISSKGFESTTTREEQVKAWIRGERKKHAGTIEANTYGGLTEFCQKACVPLADLPQTDEDAFVVLPGWRVDSNDKRIVIVTTTRRLLCNMGHWDDTLLGVDGTYQITSNGLNLFVLGVKDVQAHQHIVAIALIKSENTSDITCIFKTVFQAATKCLKKDMAHTLKHTICDNATPIFDTIAATMPNVEKRKNCFWHLLQAIKRNRNKFSSKDKRDAFEAAVRLISAVTLPGLCDKLLEKLLETLNDEPDAKTWFEENWCGERRHWQLTRVLDSRTNPVEAINSVLKRDFTNGKILPTGQVLPKLTAFLEITSKMDTTFAREVVLTAKDWKEAQDLIKDKLKGYLDCARIKRQLIFIPSTKTYLLEQEKGFPDNTLSTGIRTYKDLVLNSRDEETDTFESEPFRSMSCVQLAQLAVNYRCLEEITDNEELLKLLANVGYTCSCKFFWKYGKCKHSMAYAIMRGKLQIPSVHNYTEIAAPKTGRPRNRRKQRR